MITSSKNSQMKNITLLAKKAKARREQGLYIVEGIRMVREARNEDLAKVYIAESYHDKIEKETLQSWDYEIVSDQVFKEISDTVTPQGILALIRPRQYNLDDLIASRPNPTFLLLETLQDPGNLGTIIRTSEAADITAIIIDKNTVDLYSPKVVRSTMGAIFRLPIILTDNLAASITILKNSGIKTYAAHLNGQNAFYQEDYTKGSAFLIGNEGNGLSNEITNLADTLIHIPMAGQVESLNAAVAASLLAYESYIQKKRSIEPKSKQ